MDRPRLIRGLRIAVSAVCGILCVLLIVLWVRSYWRYDTVRGHFVKSQLFSISLWQGVVSFTTHQEADPNAVRLFGHWHIDTRTSPSFVDQPAWWFRVSLQPTLRAVVSAPNWFLVFMSATLAVIPWIQWSRRFSLRTLLIAITLIAVVLGLAAAYSHLW